MPWGLAVILPATFTFMASRTSRLHAQTLPPVCGATNVGLTQLSGSVVRNLAGQLQYTGTSNLSWDCTAGSTSMCGACYKAATEHWNGFFWSSDSSDGPHQTSFADCGSSNNSYVLNVTVMPLVAQTSYRTTLYATGFNFLTDLGGNFIGCGGTYGISTFDEYEYTGP